MTRERAASPDVDPTELLSLARTYPKEVLQNPLLPLLSVESPALWLQVVNSISGGLREIELRDIKPSQRQLLSRQVKQLAPTLTATLQLLRDDGCDPIWNMALEQTLAYKSFEDSFAALFCFSLLGTSQMHFTTATRTFEAYLFETRMVEQRRVERPYYLVECWLFSEDQGDGCVEPEQVLEAACAWLFDEVPCETMHATYLQPHASFR